MPPGSSTKGLDIYHNNPLLACLVCSRQVSANRYAQHLASCVGVGKGSVARRKGKSASAVSGNAKIKTALENRKRASFPMSSSVSRTSTPPLQAVAAANAAAAGRAHNADDASSVASDDERSTSKASMGLNGNGKRSASPSDRSAYKKSRTLTPPKDSTKMERTKSAQSLLGVSALASSQPVTGSPLNPHRYSRPIHLDSDDEDAPGSSQPLGLASSSVISANDSDIHSDDDSYIEDDKRDNGESDG